MFRNSYTINTLSKELNQNTIVAKLRNLVKSVKWGHGERTRKFSSHFELIMINTEAKELLFFSMLKQSQKKVKNFKVSKSFNDLPLFFVLVLSLSLIALMMRICQKCH